MKLQSLSAKRLFLLMAAGLVVSMAALTAALYLAARQTAVLVAGGALTLCAGAWFIALTQAFGKKLTLFTCELCRTLDDMIDGKEAPPRPEDGETQLARIGHRLERLYQIMRQNRRRVDEERQELQSLVSDISHQVKTPVSNLRMAADTLLEKPMTAAERTDFIRGMRTQTDKLDSKTSTEVLGLIKRSGVEFRQTVVMITHNNDIARLADRIVRIEDGRIAE